MRLRGLAARSEPRAGRAQAVAPGQTDQWMAGPDYSVEGLIPPMERGRPVNEQDCGTPVDLRAGNLRCK